MTIQFMKGDLMLFSTSPGGENKLGRIIKAASRRGKHEEVTFAAHAEIVANGGELLPDNDGEITTIGLSWPAIKERDLLAHTDALVRVYRLIGANEDNMERLVDELRSKVQAKNPEKYGVGVIATHALDYGLNWTVNKLSGKWLDIRPFTVLFFTSKSVCSSLVAKAYNTHTGISFGMKPRLVQPDDIDDFCKKYSTVFKLVYEGKI